MYLNTGSDDIHFFLSKVNIWMLTVRGKQHSFSTHERIYFWKCRSFRYRKCIGLRGLEPPTFVFVPNTLATRAIRARHLLSYVFEYWLWRYKYFWSKINIDDSENIYTLSYYHHQIGSMNSYPLFRVRSWNSGVRCMFFYILILLNC